MGDLARCYAVKGKCSGKHDPEESVECDYHSCDNILFAKCGTLAAVLDIGAFIYCNAACHQAVRLAL
jgi:hypothetical protein